MKTAVEWLEQQLFNKRGKFNKSDIEQAKEMEKEQIQEEWKKGYAQGYKDNKPITKYPSGMPG
jgi:hypothetical protein